MTATLEKMTVRLRLESANSGRPIAGRAVRLDDEVRISDEAGWVTFTSGVAPQLRFEISASEIRITVPVPAYGGSKSNLAHPSVTTGGLLVATMTGDVRRGFTASRAVRL